MDFIETVKTNFSPVVIFGASITGKIVLDALQILNIRPVCFCDNDAEKRKTLYHGYEVISFEQLRVEYPNANVIIAAGRYFDEIKQQLIDVGFARIFNDLDVMSCIDFEAVNGEKLQKIAWYLAKLGKLSEIRNLPEDSLHISRLNVVITSRCTLRCAQCSSLIPHYKKTVDFDTTTILNSLDTLFDWADLIYHVELLGGEPFLNKDLNRIADYLLQSGKILHIDVITNGTILPKKTVLERLRHPNLSVVIDDYGHLSRKTQALSEVLSSLDIGFRINKHWAWADLGGFEHRRRDVRQLSELFNRCHFNSCTELIEGRLHRCPRSSHGLKTGLVPDYPQDYIDLNEFKSDSNNLKEILREFFYNKKFIQACNHCDGNTSESLTLTPAEQMAACEV